MPSKPYRNHKLIANPLTNVKKLIETPHKTDDATLSPSRTINPIIAKGLFHGKGQRGI